MGVSFIRLTKVVVLLCGVMYSSSLFAQNPKQEHVKFKSGIEQAKEANELASNLLREIKSPGLAVTVIRNDSIVWSEGFGFADIGNNMPATSSTVFRIGSVSKLLTATLCARLYQSGLLDLDVPIQRYVPSFPEKNNQITTMMLLGHRAGIRHYRRNDYINRTQYPTVLEASSIFKNDTLLFIPGERYKYSSYGYVLASAVAEGSINRSFLPLIRDSLFLPLGLLSTYPDTIGQKNKLRAKNYALDSLNNPIEEEFINLSDRWGAGGFLSTSEDISRFGNSLIRDGFLTSQTRKLMVTSQKVSDGKETGVGLGWRIATDSLGHKYFHHGGETLGGRAFLLIYPDDNIVVSILSNLTFAKFGEKEALEFVRIFAQ